MTLSELDSGKTALVSELQPNTCDQGLACRLQALGIVPNKTITVLRKGWFGGPLHVRVGVTTEVAIRRQEAARVLISVS